MNLQDDSLAGVLGDLALLGQQVRMARQHALAGRSPARPLALAIQAGQRAQAGLLGALIAAGARPACCERRRPRLARAARRPLRASPARCANVRPRRRAP